MKNNWLAGIFIPWVSRQLITQVKALNKVLPESEMLLLVIAETVALLRFFTAPNARPIRCLADIVYDMKVFCNDVSAAQWSTICICIPALILVGQDGER